MHPSNDKTACPDKDVARETKAEPWAQDARQVLEDLGVSREKGLNHEEIRQRRERHGSNRLLQKRKAAAWKLILAQFKSLIVVLLAVTAAVSFAFGDVVEGIAIGAVILINAAIGFFTEWRAVRSMEALRELSRVGAKVRRNGKAQNISAEELVPGDIVLFEGGDMVAADLRLLQSSKLQANESALTGESAPASKSTGAVKANAEISDRECMLFKGTILTRGSGEGVVVATGMNSQLGEISAMVDAAEEELTPLEMRLDRLGQRLVWVTLGIVVVMAVSGIIAGKDHYVMIKTAIALAVAAIPEGLPMVATMALARGMWRMARRNVLINRLSAVETLGATGIICTDKTGTLTENRLTVVQYAFESGDVRVDTPAPGMKSTFSRDGKVIDPMADPLLLAALEVGALCNNATIRDGDENEQVGDPLEIALLNAAALAGLSREELLKVLPEESEEAFDADVKMMATYHRHEGKFRVAVKGAGEAILEVSSQVLTQEGKRELTEADRRFWEQKNTRMAADGLRVLALAARTVENTENRDYESLTFIGLVGLLDPPRHDVRDSIEQCRKSGIRVVMVTGDQPETALNVAREVGLLDADSDAHAVLGRELQDLENLSGRQIEEIRGATIFARVSPSQKLNLITIHQQAGAIVAMTGDGVNDAPALKKADIGVAMGQRGTDVAREAADMILKDDAFGSIVGAVRHGRVIFDNIRRFVVYLMSCNFSEILVVGVASVIQMPLPLLPLQILFLNLVTDLFPAMALGMGEGDSQVMERNPRDPRESVLVKRHWQAIAGYGALITASVLVALWIALEGLGMDADHAVTVSFLVLAFAQLWHVFNLRGGGTTFFRNDIVRNPYVWGALGICILLLLAAVYLPVLSDVLKLHAPGAKGWLLIIGMSLVPLLVGQVIRLLPQMKRFYASSVP
jgi:P-type Ca2+ transporter type 2C